MPGTITSDQTTADSADAVTNWISPGTAWKVAIATNSPSADLFLQGTGCIIGLSSAAAGPTTVENWAIAIAGAANLNTGKHIYIWVKCTSWPDMDTKANGGLRVCFSSDVTPTIAGAAPNDGLSNGKTFFVGGSDVNFVDGWLCYVVDPLATPTGAAGNVQGTPVMTGINKIGMGTRVTKIIGGGNFKPPTIMIDAVRYGTGLTIINGTSGAPVALVDVFSTDSSVTNSFGILTKVSGIYFGAGKFFVGTTGQTAVTFFQDTKQVLVFQDFPVSTSFYEVNLQGAASFSTTFQLGTISGGVVSSGCVVRGAGAAVWTLTASAANQTLNLYGCTISQMKAAALAATTAINGCAFSDCGEITASGASIINCSFQDMRTAAPMSALYQIRVTTTTPTLTGNKYVNCATALLWDRNADPNGVVDNSSFTSGGTGHGIELGTNCPTTINLTNVAFSGYGADATTNACIYNNSGKAITINILGTGTSPTIRNGTGASTTVVAGTVTTTVTVTDITTGSAIQSVEVLVTASSGTGPMPFQKTTSITRSGTTATATCTGHGLVNGKQALIKGADQQDYNGVFTVTVVDANTFTYTVANSPTTPATGTPVTTGVVIYGTTDASGIISDTRTHASDQPITGRARKSTATPFYKTGSISGTISHSTGFSTTVQMIRDE